MKKGRGKQKGSAFEREVCEHLSLWVSRGSREDLYWRSAMSGGRATLGAKKGKDLRYQSGDITAVHPDGHVLTDKWFIECKFVKQLNVDGFLLTAEGPLVRFWRRAVRDALRYERDPMLIAKENRGEIIVITRQNHLAHYLPPIVQCHAHRRTCDITLFHDLMQTEFQ